jgi:hypothetical protein
MGGQHVLGVDGKVEAFDTRTGKKDRVPPHFIGDPIVGRYLQVTPQQEALDAGQVPPAAGPTAAASVEQLRAYAEHVGIDVGDASTVTDLLGVIHNHVPLVEPAVSPGDQPQVLTPDDTWTRAELDEHAAALGVDTTGLANKGEVLAAISDATTTTTTDGDGSSDEIPGDRGQE